MTSPSFPEQYLYKFWQSGFLFGKTLMTENAQPVSILKPGLLNPTSGPDFTDCELIINNQRLTGAVEIHVRSEDWFHHGHYKDPCFNDTILHLSFDNGPGYESVQLSDGRRIPQLTLSRMVGLSDILSILTYSDRLNFSTDFPCNPQRNLPGFLVDPWITELGHRFFLKKMNRFLDRYKSLQRQLDYVPGKRYLWDQLLYEGLFRALGYPHNARQMETIARLTPVLDWPSSGDIGMQLFSDWMWLSGINRVESELPQKPRPPILRLPNLPEKVKRKAGRAANQPENRFRAASGLVARFERTGFIKPLLITLDAHLTMKSTIKKVLADLDKLLVTEEGSGATIGRERRESILFNNWIPVVYLYAKEINRADLMSLCLNLCDFIPFRQDIRKDADLRSRFHPGQNSITSHWGLLYLNDEFCQKKRCMQCRIGVKLSTGQVG